jgi:hypothetical protein
MEHTEVLAARENPLKKKEKRREGGDSFLDFTLQQQDINT